MSANTPREPTRLGRATVAVVWLGAAAATIAFLLVAAGRAEGGTYRAVQCHKAHGAGRGDFSFERSSEHYASLSDCEGRGLVVRHRARSTRRDRWGGWTLRAPAGALFSSLRARVAGTAAAGHAPELLVGVPGSDPTPFGRAGGSPHLVRWSGAGAEVFSSRLRCSRADGCGEGASARAMIRSVSLRLLDEAAPSAELAGQLAQARTQRGVRGLEALAGDPGSGVRRIFLEVNSKPLGARKLDCELRGGVALRLRPCPRSAERGWTLDTDGRAFRQGLNRLRVCVDDWAPGDGKNRACARHKVRIDNECPVDGGTEHGVIRARIAGAGRNRAIPRDRAVRVEGTLTGQDGRGIAGAEVCVATRTALGGAEERVVATPSTGPGGGFHARLAPGPSREVRVAHWPDTENVAERHLRLRVRARPRLRVLPRRTLRNGETARFAVRLHRPHRGGREVRLEVHTGRRWQVIRSHRANARGLWRDSYRFTSTTGSRSYRFRAAVPRQSGYPYERGWSKVRRVRVRG